MEGLRRHVRRWAKHVLLTLALIPSAYLAWMGRDMPHLGGFHDDGIYLQAAKNLAEGNPYRIESLPWQPAQTKYPPLYPLYLSTAWHFTGNLEAVRPIAMGLAWLWMPAWIAAVVWLFRKQGCRPSMTYALAALLAIHPYATLSATRLMTDLMLSALAAAALASSQYPFGCGVFASLSVLTRTASAPLAAGISIDLLLARRWRDAATMLVTPALALAAWTAWAAAHRTGESGLIAAYYSDYLAFHRLLIPFEALPAHVYSQIDHLVNAAATLLLVNHGDGFFWTMWKRVVFALTVAGIVRLMREGRFRAFGWYAALYSVLLLCWYGPPEPRFLLPILPLLAVGLSREIQNLGGLVGAAWKRRRTERVLAGAIGSAGFLAVCGMAWQLVALTGSLGPGLLAKERTLAVEAEASYRWIRSNTPPDATFFAVDDPGLFLHTGRRALRSPLLGSVFSAKADGSLMPSTSTLEAMQRYALDCLYVSAKNFESSRGPLRISLENTPLVERYRTPGELVACSPQTN